MLSFLKTWRADGVCRRGYCWRHEHRQRQLPASSAGRTSTGHMTSCGFSSMQQCKDASAGIGGDCFRDPNLGSSNPSGAFAYAPKAPHAAKGGSPRQCGEQRQLAPYAVSDIESGRAEDRPA